MLNVKKFTFNPFLENTYVVTDEFKNAVFIDPGCYYKAEQNELDSYVLKNNLKLMNKKSTKKSFICLVLLT